MQRKGKGARTPLIVLIYSFIEATEQFLSLPSPLINVDICCRCPQHRHQALHNTINQLNHTTAATPLLETAEDQTLTGDRHRQMHLLHLAALTRWQDHKI